MKKLKLAVALLILFLFESTVLSSFQIFGNTIPLTFTFALVIAIYEDRWDALLAGVFSGFLHDIYSPILFGLNMLLNMWFCVGAGKVVRYLRRENRILMSVYMMLVALLRYGFHYIFMKSAGYSAHMPSLIVLALLVLLISWPLTMLYNRLLRPVHRRRKYRY